MTDLAKEVSLSKNPGIFFLTGGAGTGKTTLLRQFVDDFSGKVAVVAPTGVAALNCGGMTIHKFFRLPPHPVQSASIKKNRNSMLYRHMDVLVIDEISMVRADLLDTIDQVLRVNRERLDEPFGGVTVLAVGDLFQLPPVIAKHSELSMIEHRYRTPCFYSSNVAKQTNLKPRILTKVYRQESEEFSELLDRIRRGLQSTADLDLLNTRVVGPAAVPHDAVYLCPTNEEAATINTGKLAELPTELHTFQGSTVGKFDIETDKMPAPQQLELKVGSRVMFVKNGKFWVNGSLGDVLEIGPRTIRVKLLGRGENAVYEVEREVWKNLEYAYDPVSDKFETKEVGRYTQFPLIPAWAITIHKSQGKTLKKLHLQLSNSGIFENGQLYVALSRAESLEGVSLSIAITSGDVRVDGEIQKFYKYIERNG